MPLSLKEFKMTTTFPLSRQEIEMKLMKLPIQAPRMNELDKHNGVIKVNNKKYYLCHG